MKFLFSSVVRGARQGESHGGLFIADFADGSHSQVFDHNDGQIDFAGRGADRGLRGIAVAEKEVYVAASDEIFVFDKSFNIVSSIKHPLLKHAHEVSLTSAGLFVVSTGCNSILLFDVETHKCSWGLKLELGTSGQIRVHSFDPNRTRLTPDVSAHLNMVVCKGSNIYFSGRKLKHLLMYNNKSGLQSISALPLGTHNAQPIESGVIFNDTEDDRVTWTKNGVTKHVELPRFEDSQLDWPIAKNERVARPSFGRGLCLIDERFVVAGSSPSTLSLIDLETALISNTITTSYDVRNAVHGLVCWPE